MNHIKTMINKYILLCIAVLLTSCVSNTTPKDAIGVYTVVKHLCSGNETSRDACEDIVFLEIVRGNFYKVSMDEVAFVIWSGGKDLEYNARKIENSIHIENFPFTIELENDSAFTESFTLTSNDSGLYTYGQKGALFTLNLKKATQEELKQYNKSYPGNN